MSAGVPRRAAPRAAALYVEAVVLLLGSYSCSGWVADRLWPVLAKLPAGWMLMYPSHLAILLVLVWALNHFARQRRGLPAWGPRWSEGVRRVPETMLVLGAMCVAVRLLDSGFDERDFAARGLGNPARMRQILLALPVAVCIEELILRSCQARLRSALGPGASVLAITSVFAILHLGPGVGIRSQQVTVLLAAIVGGAAFARLYERSASLGLLIVTHVGYDLLAIAQSKLHVDRRALAELALFGTWILASLLLALAMRGQAQAARGGALFDRAVPERAASQGRWAQAVGAAATALFAIGVPLIVRRFWGAL